VYLDTYYPESEGNMFFGIVGIRLQDCTVSEARDHNVEVYVLSFKYEIN
jgi:hypothetical protein